jgi:hypothetical protein
MSHLRAAALLAHQEEVHVFLRNLLEQIEDRQGVQHFLRFAQEGLDFSVEVKEEIMK